MGKVRGRDEGQRVTDAEHAHAVKAVCREQEKELEKMKEDRVELVKKYQNKIKALNAKLKVLTNLITELRTNIEELEGKLTTSIAQNVVHKREKEELEQLVSDIPDMNEKKKGQTIRSLRAANRKLNKDLEEAQQKASSAVV